MITWSTYFYNSTSSPRQYPTSPPTTFMNTFCLYNNQLQLLFSPIMSFSSLVTYLVTTSSPCTPPCPSPCATFLQFHLSNIQRLPNGSNEYFCLYSLQLQLLFLLEPPWWRRPSLCAPPSPSPFTSTFPPPPPNHHPASSQKATTFTNTTTSNRFDPKFFPPSCLCPPWRPHRWPCPSPCPPTCTSPT